MPAMPTASSATLTIAAEPPSTRPTVLVQGSAAAHPMPRSAIWEAVYNQHNDEQQPQDAEVDAVGQA